MGGEKARGHASAVQGVEGKKEEEVSSAMHLVPKCTSDMGPSQSLE